MQSVHKYLLVGLWNSNDIKNEMGYGCKHKW